MLIFFLKSCQQKSQEGKKKVYEELREQRAKDIETEMI